MSLCLVLALLYLIQRRYSHEASYNDSSLEESYNGHITRVLHPPLTLLADIGSFYRSPVLPFLVSSLLLNVLVWTYTSQALRPNNIFCKRNYLNRVTFKLFAWDYFQIQYFKIFQKAMSRTNQ